MSVARLYLYLTRVSIDDRVAELISWPSLLSPTNATKVKPARSKGGESSSSVHPGGYGESMTAVKFFTSSSDGRSDEIDDDDDDDDDGDEDDDDDNEKDWRTP
mmetsp:Transcript_12027/g.26314  ORF Transcript_12027/g.26314 Transcript_12027/m.26314 type:complete len:103 (-) Transcript_12027:247-555(-)